MSTCNGDGVIWPMGDELVAELVRVNEEHRIAARVARILNPPRPLGLREQYTAYITDLIEPYNRVHLVFQNTLPHLRAV